MFIAFPNLILLDIVLGIILLLAFIRGFSRGFIVEIASLIALFLGIYGAIHCSFYAAGILSKYLDWRESYISLTSFILTFLVIVIIILLLGKLITKLTHALALGLLNRLAGGIFGLLKWALILATLILFFHNFNEKTQLVKKERLAHSILYTPLKDFGEVIIPEALQRLQRE